MHIDRNQSYIIIILNFFLSHMTFTKIHYFIQLLRVYVEKIIRSFMTLQFTCVKFIIHVLIYL